MTFFRFCEIVVVSKWMKWKWFFSIFNLWKCDCILDDLLFNFYFWNRIGPTQMQFGQLEKRAGVAKRGELWMHQWNEAQRSSQLRLKQWRTGTLQNEWNSLHSPMTQTPPSWPPSSNFTLLLRRLRNVREFQTSNVSWWMAQRQQGNNESMQSSALTMSNTAINCHHCQTIAPFDLIDRVMLSPPGNVKT